MSQKEYKCGFTDCLHPGEMVSSDIAVRDGGKCYHPDCLEERKIRNNIFKIYDKYYQPGDGYNVIRKSINNLSRIYGSNFVLYVLCQAIHKKIPFRGIGTLGYIVKTDEKMKKDYEELMASKAIKEFDFDTVETNKPEVIQYKKEDDNSWEKILFG